MHCFACACLLHLFFKQSSFTSAQQESDLTSLVLLEVSGNAIDDCKRLTVRLADRRSGKRKRPGQRHGRQLLSLGEWDPASRPTNKKAKIA